MKSKTKVILYLLPILLLICFMSEIISVVILGTLLAMPFIKYVLKDKKISNFLMAISILSLLLITGCGVGTEETISSVNDTTSTLEITTTSIMETTAQSVTSQSEIQTALNEIKSSIMEVHFIDVGQADCILIESAGEYMLVDAGNNGDAKTIIDYLESERVSTLKYVVGTHPHEDHIGSLDTVINNFDVETVILPPKEHTSKTFEDVLDAIESNSLEITLPNVGDIYEIGDAAFTVLAPMDDKDYGDELNNWSIGIKLINGNTSFVMCGDAEEEAEEDIINSGIDISANVLKLNHHGSNTSSSEKFLNSVNPEYAVICCETGNSYGHPHKETIEKLIQYGIKTFRIDEQGTIVAISDGETVTWSTEPCNLKLSSQQLETTNSSTTQIIETTTQEVTTIETTTEEVTETTTSTVQNVEVTVHITKTGEKYHSAGCQYLKKSDISISLSDAKSRGYTPCSKCHPPQ